MPLTHTVSQITLNQPLLVDKEEADIINILNWLDREIINPPEATKKQKIFAKIGQTDALLATAVCYPLGEAFGKMLAKNLGITDQGSINALSAYFGGTCLVALSILTGRLSKVIFSNFVTPVSEEKIIITKQENQVIKNTLKALKWIISAIAMIPNLAVNHKYLYAKTGYFTYIFDLSAIIETTVLNQWSIGTALPALYNSVKYEYQSRKYQNLTQDEKESGEQIRFRLKRKLKESFQFIEQMSEEKIIQLFTAVFSNPNPGNDLEPEQLLTRMKLFFNPCGDQKPPSIKPKSIGKKIAETIGTVVGTVSPVSFYYNGRVPVESVTKSAALGKFVGGVAFVTNSTLNAYTSRIIFGQLYDGFAKAPSLIKELPNRCMKISKEYLCSTELITDVKASLLSGFKFLFSMAVATSAATPSTVLTISAFDIKKFGNQLLIACSFLGPFSTFFWSTAKALNGVNKRDIILEVVNKIIAELDGMKDEDIKALYSTIFTSAIENEFTQAIPLMQL